MDQRKDPNKLFLVKLGQGEPTLRILLSKKDEAQTQRRVFESDRNPQLGVKTRQRPIDELIPHKKVGGWLFYDMGRKWDGSAFVDIDYNFLAAAYVQHTNGILSNFTGTTPQGTLANYEALAAAIIDYDLATIETQHPLMNTDSDGDYFAFELWNDSTFIITSDGDYDNFLPTGWKVPADVFSASNLEIRFNEDHGGPGFFYWLNLIGTAVHKITATYDYSAATVPYVPTKTDKFFLMPLLTKFAAEVDFDKVSTVFGDPPTTFSDDYFTMNVQTIPRTPILDITSPLFRKQPTSYDFTISDFNRTIAAAWIAYMKTVGVGQYRAVAQSHPFSDWTWTLETPSAFPSTPNHEPSNIPIPGFGGGLSSISIRPEAGLPAGTLLAIIKQGSDLKFVWMNEI